MVDPLGNVTTRTFDLRGRLTRQTDTMGHDAQQTWDGLDRLVRTERTAGGGSDDEVQETAYYPGGEVRQTTNANGAVTTYTIDGLSRVVATETTFDGETLTTATTWDANGNKETEKDRRGVTRKNTYDDLNRLKAVEITAGLAGEGPTGTIAEYGYDLVGNKTSETNLARLTTRFEYDGLYRVTAKVLPETMAAAFTPAGPLTERYGYDKVGNRTSVTDPNGHATSTFYDEPQPPDPHDERPRPGDPGELRRSGGLARQQVRGAGPDARPADDVPLRRAQPRARANGPPRAGRRPWTRACPEARATPPPRPTTTAPTP